MVTGSAYYQSILDGVYEAITGLDPTGYRIDPVSIWSRGRRMTGPSGGAVRELEVLVDLGRAATYQRSSIVHEIRISWPMRYRPSSEEAGGINDQARFHASARAVAEALTMLSPSSQRDSRLVPSGWQLIQSPAGDEWVVVELSASLTISRGT